MKLLRNKRIKNSKNDLEVFRIWKYSIRENKCEATSYVGNQKIIKKILRSLSKSKYYYYEMREE